MFGFRPEPNSPKHLILENNLHKVFRAGAGNAEFSDLRAFSKARHNQKNTSSCVAQSVVKALEIKRVMAGNPHFDLSVLAVYYLARELMTPKETNEDAGTYVSHACDVLRRFGVCLEEEFPFDPSNVLKAPSWMVMRNAYLNKISAFFKISSTGNDRIEMIKSCLRQGHPVVFGTIVGQNWIKYKNGTLEIPADNIGRHATVLVGYDGRFIGENSWGSSWGENGFYYMDPEYLKWNQSCDFWVIKEGGK